MWGLLNPIVTLKKNRTFFYTKENRVKSCKYVAKAVLNALCILHKHKMAHCNLSHNSIFYYTDSEYKTQIVLGEMNYVHAFDPMNDNYGFLFKIDKNQ